MSWESIEIGKKTPTPLVTFTLSNTIRFNKAFIDEYELHKADKVEVLYNVNEDKIRVGFLFYTLDEEKENTLKLSWINDSSAFVSGYSVMTKLGIDNSKLRREKFKRRFVPYVEELGDRKILVIDFAEIKKEEDESV
jgi:hypothetical protein